MKLSIDPKQGICTACHEPASTDDPCCDAPIFVDGDYIHADYEEEEE